MAEALLELTGIVKRFGGLAATDRVDFWVRSAEVHALIGPNGAGKTTLIHQISGALRPDEGRVRFAGHDVTTVSMHGRVMAGLARSYQVTSIFKRCTVLDNVVMASQAHAGSSLRFWRSVIGESALFDAARDILERVGLTARAGAVAGTLAHGEQRQLEVGLALATRPKLLLLDEPMAGMGPDESERMVGLISSLRMDVSLLLVEHDMEAVFRLADRISVLVSGRVIASGSPQEIRGDAEVKRAYLGEEATL